LFSVDSNWFVHLSWSKSVLESSGNYKAVPQADVRVGNEFGESTQLISLGNGWFGSNMLHAELDVNYSLEVQVEGRPKIIAHDRIPDTTSILSITHNSKNNFTEEQIRFSVEFEDEPGEDFYYLEVLNGHDLDPVNGYSGYEILAIQGNFQPIYPGLFGQDYFYRRAYVTDEGLDGQRMQLDFFIPQYYTEGYIVIRLVRPSRNAYLYNYSADVQEVSEFNPFAQPAIIHTNIENGMGIFAGCGFVERRFKIGP